MTELNTNDFEQAIRIAGVNLVAIKGVMSKKTAPKDIIFSEAPAGCEDLKVELHELVSPGSFKAIVDSCYDLPEADSGEVRATKNGQVWIKSKDAWVYLTHVAGAK